MKITEQDLQEYNALSENERKEYKDIRAYVELKNKREALKMKSCPLNISGEDDYGCGS